MENYTQNIELINNYLNKGLSERESKDFEKQLKSDIPFKEDYETHIVFLEGLKRQQLKTEILKAKQTYIKVKWMKFLGISITVLTVLAVVYFTVSNKSIEPIQNKSPENKSIVVDTILSKKNIETSINIDEPIILEDAISFKKESIKVEALKPVKNVENSFKKTPEKFKINTQKDTVFLCKEGTKLIVKANSFVDSNGNNINGTIDLNVTEYYKLSDILLANLTTTSNGKQLETGGMLFIEAKKDETNLILADSSSIEISFPTDSKKEGMQIFSGKWKNEIINWNLQKSLVEETVIDEIEVSNVEENIEVPFAIVEQVPIYPGCESSDKQAERECTSIAISRFVQRNFNTETAKNIGLTGSQRINTLFKINQKGNATDIRSRASDPDLEDEANRVISLLPQMKPGTQRGKTVTVPYSLPIIFTVENDTEFIAKVGDDKRKLKQLRDSINNKRFKDRLASKDSINVTTSEVNRYILRTSELGWINCDRFIRGGGKQKIKYKLKIDDNGEIRVNMIFKSINSILPSFRIGNIFDFEIVPKNQDIILIAIKKDKGKLYMDLVETTTQEKPDFNFKQLTISEMKVQLEKFDVLFK